MKLSVMIGFTDKETSLFHNVGEVVEFPESRAKEIEKRGFGNRVSEPKPTKDSGSNRRSYTYTAYNSRKSQTCSSYFSQSLRCRNHRRYSFSTFGTQACWSCCGLCGRRYRGCRNGDKDLCSFILCLRR